MRSIRDVDRALRIAAVLVALAAAFFVLIMGMFSTTFDSSTAMLVGMGIVLGALWVLLLMIVARFARQLSTSPGGLRDRKAFLITLFVSCIGGATLIFGTWQGVHLCMQSPIYQEAAMEPATPSTL
jgi:hypothetical protein